MPETITWGHVLMLAGLLVGLFAVANLFRWLRQRDFGRGTPQYADGRLARRAAFYGLTIGFLLLAGGCLTPLRDLPIA